VGIELPGWLEYVGGLVGEKFPEGDETACRRQRDRWQDFANQLEGHNDGIAAAAKAALEGFSSGQTHDALGPQLSGLTSGDQSIEKIVEQLRQLAHAVDEAATEIEFAKQMFILNLGILAASIAAMIASAWINWGAPAEIAAAVAAMDAVLSQVIRAAIGKLVSAAALRIIERLAIKALEGAAINAFISGGMNAAVQGEQIAAGNRHGFDWGSFGDDVGAGAIQGGVAAPFLRGVHERTPGFHPSERLSEFGRSVIGNTIGGLAAQAPSGQFDLGNAAKGGAAFGAMDGVRSTPKSIKSDWAGRDGTPSDLSAPHAPDAKPDALSPKGPELAEPGPAPPAHGTEGTHDGSGNVDVPLNLGTGDHGGGRPEVTHSGGDGPSAPRTSVSDTSAPSSAQPTGTPVAHSADSVAPHASAGRDVADTTAPPTGADRAPPRPPELADPALPPKTSDRVDTAPSARGPDRVDAASQPKGSDRVDAVQPKSEGARPADSSHPQTGAEKTAGATPTADSSAGPAKPETRATGDAGASHALSKKNGDGSLDPGQRHEAGSLDAAALSPIVVAPGVPGIDRAPHSGPAATAPEPRAPKTRDGVGPDRPDSEPRGPELTGPKRFVPARATPPADGGEQHPHANRDPVDDPSDTHPERVDPSELPPYRQRQMELALSPEKLERDLLDGGCPPDIAATARNSPYGGMTRQELLDRYCNPDGSVRWPPRDGFADGRYEVADRIPEGEPLDRIGEILPQRGDFMGSAGDSYPGRALAPGTSGTYHRLEGTGKQLPTDWELRHGKVAAAFDQRGGGKQWVVVDTSDIVNGAPRKVYIDALIDGGYVRPVEVHAQAPLPGGADHERPSVRSDREERVHQLVDEYHEHLAEHPSEAAGLQHDWDAPHHDHEPIFHGEDITADERQALRDVWHELSEDERRYLYSREPMFGEHAELPVAECDHYARQAIGDMRRELMGGTNRQVMAARDEDRLRALDNIEKSLVGGPDEPDRFLLGFESDGRSITAVGNPDTASATVVFVPGTFTSDQKLNDHLESPGLKNLFGLGTRAEKTGYMEISQRIRFALEKKFDGGDVAVVDYQNYHAPQSLVNPVTGAPNPRFGEEGAPSLRNHLDRLQHTSEVQDGKFWVAGHSYGTVLVGEAAKGGHGLNADGIINLGSPGMRVHDVSGLQLKGRHLIPGDAPVHTMTRIDDPIHFVDGARILGLSHLNVGHGLMPHHAEFGGHVWDVDTSAGQQRDPHNAYFRPGSVALKNIAKIIAGDLPPPSIRKQWTDRNPLPFTTGYFRPPPTEPLPREQPDDDQSELASVDFVNLDEPR